MEAKQRTVLTNEDDTRKVEVYTQGDVDVTPTGIPLMASDAGGTIRILKQDDKGNLNVNIQGSGGTIGVYLDAINQTIMARVGQVDGTVAVYFSPSEPTIKGITNSIGVYVDTIRQTAGVRVGQVDGTVAIYFSQSNPKVNLGSDIINIGNTASVASAGGSVSGSTSGVSVSGVQLIAPVASRVIKVYAFSLTTTAQVHLSPRFTNGAGTGPTELWRVGLQAPAQGIAGANLAVTPPGYLFATPSGATLCLVLDSASLVHYSVAYFRETA